jgi:hypothetical protein
MSELQSLRTSKDKTTLVEAFNQLKAAVESAVLTDRGYLQSPPMITKTWKGQDPMLAAEARVTSPATK